MKKTLLAAALATATAVSSQAGVFTFAAVLNGANEVPASGSPGVGAAAATYVQETGIFTLTGYVSGLSSTVVNAHIHFGAAGANGPVVIPITAPFGANAGFISTGPIVLTTAQKDQLVDEMWYVNIHTTGNPGGEVRGQLLITSVPEPETYAAMAGAALVAFGVWRRARR